MRAVVLPCCLESSGEISFVLLARFPIEVADYVVEVQRAPLVALNLVEGFPKFVRLVAAKNKLLVVSAVRIGAMSEKIYALRFEEIQRKPDLVI